MNGKRLPILDKKKNRLYLLIDKANFFVKAFFLNINPTRVRINLETF